MSRKALKVEHLSVCMGFVRGTWRNGSNNENSRETCNGRLWKHSFLL
jgi:hypothetical protein